MNLEDSKVLMNIEKYGNTTSATLPLVLAIFEHLFKKEHDNLTLVEDSLGFYLSKMGIRQKINLN
jgi:3-oxoacyl-[acyl-carrier-protein] synthase-3